MVIGTPELGKFTRVNNGTKEFDLGIYSITHYIILPCLNARIRKCIYQPRIINILFLHPHYFIYVLIYIYK